MFRFATVALIIAVPVTASAECYVRSAMTKQQQATISRVTDIDTWTVPVSATQNKCIASYRALIGTEWHTVETEATGPKTMPESELCRQAMDRGHAQLLSRASVGVINVETNLVCSDQARPQVRSVRIGDTVKESEVRPHPNFPNTFRHRGAQCRWFVEPELRNQDLYQRQGIICLSHGTEWRVVDKW